MAIYFKSNSPKNLLSKLKEAVTDGRITAWQMDDDGDFTHTKDQWQYRAWLRPKLGEKKLTFYIIRPKDSSISSQTYAIYHSRFVESALHQFDDLFDNVVVSALPEGHDDVSIV